MSGTPQMFWVCSSSQKAPRIVTLGSAMADSVGNSNGRTSNIHNQWYLRGASQSLELSPQHKSLGNLGK